MKLALFNMEWQGVDKTREIKESIGSLVITKYCLEVKDTLDQNVYYFKIFLAGQHVMNVMVMLFSILYQNFCWLFNISAWQCERLD